VVNYNVSGDTGRECLKITTFGQSAAKLLLLKILETINGSRMFNDYPAREYTQVSGNGRHPIKRVKI
jgi:hypothetical protein